jgi:type III secretion protein T
MMAAGHSQGLAQAVLHWTAVVVLFGIRPAAVFIVLPATSEPMMRPSIRNLIVVVVAAFAGSYAPDAMLAKLGDHVELLGFAAREAAIGATLGFAASKGFWIAQSVGALVDNLAGYNNVQITNPSSSEQSTPVSDILLQMFCSAFWASGGMLLLLGTLFETYRWWPSPSSWPDWPKDFAPQQLSDLMRVIVSLSMPLLFLLALVDIGLGLMSRSAKNLDLSAVSQPLKSATALLAMVLFSTVFLDEIRGFISVADLPAWLAKWSTHR